VSTAPAAAVKDAEEAALAFAQRSPKTTRSRTITWQDPVPAAAAGAGLAGIEYITAIRAGEIPPPPIAVTMKMSIVEVEEGRTVFEGEPGEEHYNPIGVVHGGYASTLLDSALGSAVHTTLPAGVGYTTQTLEMKFQRPITRDTGRVRAEAEVVHRGGRQATVEARLVAAESGKLLATGTSTCLILEP
ncbi:MAG: PaaI family thioesterase, partial [Solirubrobacterales bacterium]